MADLFCVMAWRCDGHWRLGLIMYARDGGDGHCAHNRLHIVQHLEFPRHVTNFNFELLASLGHCTKF